MMMQLLVVVAALQTLQDESVKLVCVLERSILTGDLANMMTGHGKVEH